MRFDSTRVRSRFAAGITTLVGLTGTDSITRSMPNLLQTLLGLADNGLTTYMFSGSYHVPVVTLTETIERYCTRNHVDKNHIMSRSLVDTRNAIQ